MTTLTEIMAPDHVTRVRATITRAQRLGVRVDGLSRREPIGMVRRGGTVSLNGLPPGDFPLSIFDTVLRGITVRGSIVGTIYGLALRAGTSLWRGDIAQAEAEIEGIVHEKEEAVSAQDFLKAAELRDKQEYLRKKLADMKKEWKAQQSDKHLVVDENTIADVIAKMTGIPLVRMEEQQQ